MKKTKKADIKETKIKKNKAIEKLKNKILYKNYDEV